MTINTEEPPPLSRREHYDAAGRLLTEAQYARGTFECNQHRTWLASTALAHAMMASMDRPAVEAVYQPGRVRRWLVTTGRGVALLAAGVLGALIVAAAYAALAYKVLGGWPW